MTKDGPITFKPDIKKKPSNISLRELVESVILYVSHVGKLKIGNFSFYADEMGTHVTLGDVSTEGGSPHQNLEFLILDKRVRSEDGKIGSQPISFEIKSYLSPKMYAGPPTILFDVVAVPNHDRSVTFHKVKNRTLGGVDY